MSRIQFGVCEFSFPCWGPLALQMAHEAGFTGMQLADAGGSTNAYPLNNKRVQESYLEAAAKYGITLQSIHLYTRILSVSARLPPRAWSAWRASRTPSSPPVRWGFPW